MFIIKRNFNRKKSDISPLIPLKLEQKLKSKKMVLIKASKKKEDNNLYYRYYQIDCYILKDFENFILRFDRSSNLLGKK